VSPMADESCPPRERLVTAREAIEHLAAEAEAIAGRADLETWVRQRAAGVAFECRVVLDAVAAMEAGEATDHHTTAAVAALPACDLCGDGTVAVYDSRTLQGPWGYLCEAHWQSHGVGQLGTGHGQRLIVREPAS